MVTKITKLQFRNDSRIYTLRNADCSSPMDGKQKPKHSIEIKQKFLQGIGFTALFPFFWDLIFHRHRQGSSGVIISAHSAAHHARIRSHCQPDAVDSFHTVDGIWNIGNKLVQNCRKLPATLFARDFKWKQLHKMKATAKYPTKKLQLKDKNQILKNQRQLRIFQ
jgi:hypothetical protein